jgi:hypothetical protein
MTSAMWTGFVPALAASAASQTRGPIIPALTPSVRFEERPGPGNDNGDGNVRRHARRLRGSSVTFPPNARPPSIATEAALASPPGDEPRERNLATVPSGAAQVPFPIEERRAK